MYLGKFIKGLATRKKGGEYGKVLHIRVGKYTSERERDRVCVRVCAHTNLSVLVLLPSLLLLLFLFLRTTDVLK